MCVCVCGMSRRFLLRAGSPRRDVAASEVRPALPTPCQPPQHLPGGSSAGPALPDRGDDFPGAGTPRYPCRAFLLSLLLLPAPSSLLCCLLWGLTSGLTCRGFGRVGPPRELPGGVGLGLALWGWGKEGRGGGLPSRGSWSPSPVAVGPGQGDAGWDKGMQGTAPGCSLLSAWLNMSRAPSLQPQM